MVSLPSSITCLVIEPDGARRARLVRYLNQYPSVGTVRDFSGELSEITVALEEAVDLIFCNVRVADLSGFDLLRELPSPDTRVVYHSDDGDAAVRAFEVGALDYLITPLTLGRLLQSLRRYEARYRNTRTQTISPATSTGRLTIRSNGRNIRIPHHDIRYVLSDREYLEIHLRNGEKILALGSLYKLAADLPAGEFLQIHRSTIISLADVTAVDARRVWMGEKTFAIGGSFRARVRRAFRTL